MGEMIAVCAILGGIIELIAAVGGPDMAGVGLLSHQPAPEMDTGSLVVGLAAAALSITGGALVGAGRSSVRWGLVLCATAVVGIVVVGPWTGWYTFGCAFTFLAGVMAIFRRRRRGTA